MQRIRGGIPIGAALFDAFPLWEHRVEVPRMSPTRLLTALALLLLISPAARPDETPKFETVDFAKIERRIAKEPKYVAPPLYALFLFGPKGDMKVWAVIREGLPKL